MVDHGPVPACVQTVPPEQVDTGMRVPGPLVIFQELLPHKDLRYAGSRQQDGRSHPAAAAGIPGAAVLRIGQPGDALILSDFDNVVILHAGHGPPTVIEPGRV